MLSRSRASLRPAALSIAALAAVQAHAIIDTTSTTDPGPIDSTYQYVGSFDMGSGVAVSPNVVLTAGHVGATNFVLNGTTYTVKSTVLSTTTDLQLVTLNQTLPGYYAIGSSVAVGSTITMVGDGATGVVNSAGTGYSVVNEFDRRAGTNTIDGEQNVQGAGPSFLSFISGPGQAVLAGYDSGGGWFQNGLLVGTSDFTFTTEQGLPDYGFADASGQSYFGSGAIDLTSPDARAFLISNGIIPTPEPATCAAFGLGALTLLRRRRRA